MIKAILDFLQKERIYLGLFAAVCLIYGVLLTRAQTDALSPAQSPQYSAFREAEKEFQLNLKSEKDLEALFKRKPAVAAVFMGYSVVFGFLFTGGCLLLSLLAASARLRARWLKTYPLESKPWGLGILLRVLVHFLTLSLGFNLLVNGLTHWFYPGLSQNALALIHTAVMDAAIAIIIVKELGFSWNSVKSLGFDLKGRSFWKEMGFGLSGYMAVVPVFAFVLFILITLAQKMSYEPEPHPLVDVFLSEEKRDQWMVAFSIFLACLWGPFFEEIFFRGLCYPIFKRFLGVMPGGVLSAVFFAVIHHNEFAFLPIFLLGLGLAYLYEKRGSLIAPITLHVFHNSLFIGYFFSAKALLGTG